MLKAGSGKSTLVRFIIAALGLDDSQVAYISYTGKAAQVLRSKGCSNATTAHKLLYFSRLNEKTGKFTYIPRKVLEHRYKLIIVDEVSMIPQDIWDLLLSHKIHIIALGDPGQLPAVSGENIGILNKPHIFLDEIMRQAQDSEIIRLTMDIREERPIQFTRGNEVRVVRKEELQSPGILRWADQIIVGLNRTRFFINNKVREDIYNTKKLFPINGDKIICLKNNWELINDSNDALVNGLSGYISNIREGLRSQNPFAEKFFVADFQPEIADSSIFKNIMIDELIFTEHRPSTNILVKNRVIPFDYAPEQFDFGYAITAWKSQGSEYDKVLAIAEPLPMLNKEEYKQFLYTVATRASKKLILVKNF